MFNLLLQYIIDTTGREFSADNAMNFLKHEGRNISTETLYVYLDALCKALIIKKIYRYDIHGKAYVYLDALCKALIIKKIYRYDIHGKAILKTLNKYYMTDLGIAQIKNNNFEINKSFALENVVYNELLERGYDVYIGKTKKGEIDFIATKTDEKIYIQVAYFLDSDKVIEREFGAFADLNDDFHKYVLSLDKNNLSRNGIIHKNIIEWLLEN